MMITIKQTLPNARPQTMATAMLVQISKNLHSFMLPHSKSQLQYSTHCTYMQHMFVLTGALEIVPT
jgi:hypothetical protein